MFKEDNVFELTERGLIAVSGADAPVFLQGLISNDLNKLDDKNAVYTLFLTPQGKFLFDFFIIKNADEFLLDVDKNRIEELLDKLKFYKLRSQITINNLTNKFKIIWLKNSALYNNINQLDYIKSYPDPRSDKMGMRFIVENSSAIIEKILPAEKIYHQQRINNFIAEGGKDLIPGKSFPLEYNLEYFQAIDFHKGCYVGQEPISRTYHRGTVRKRIAIVKGNHFTAGEEIIADGQEIGIVTSVEEDIALALIRVEDYQKLPKNASIKTKNGYIIEEILLLK